MNNYSPKLKKALSEIEKLNLKLQKDPQRPVFHFIAPARWMNDPNGPVFHNGEYHIFYQFNPYSDTWGNIHWGHAKSFDLINWKHLPIALIPSSNWGESHCFSGSCVIDDETPKIIYTSIGPKKPPSTGAEQWLAIGNNNFIKWEKFKDNPIMKYDIHNSLIIKDWRDPFVWKEENYWYAVIGGHLINPKRPLVLIYRSTNLKDWEFLNPLIIEEKKRGRNWECPNFFKLEEKYVLIVSPHKEVIYAIGDIKDFKFIPHKWHIFDYGKCFYATNILRDKKNDRVILWGWIKGGGDIKGWNGCLSLPRILKLSEKMTLKVYPLKELKKLRLENISRNNIEIINNREITDKILHNPCLEIKIKFIIKNIKVIAISYSKFNSENGVFIHYNKKSNLLKVGKEKGFFNIEDFKEEIKLHIFIDHSVIEIFINNRYCITSRLSINDNVHPDLGISVVKGKIKINKIDIWSLKPIW